MSELSTRVRLRREELGLSQEQKIIKETIELTNQTY